MSKKRKEPPQSSTLFSFFARGESDASTPVKTKKKPEIYVNERETTFEAACVSRKAKEEPQDRTCKTQGANIIIIESDEDEDAGRQLVDGSDGVEVVAGPSYCKLGRETQKTTFTRRTLEGGNNPSREDGLQADGPENIHIDSRKTTCNSHDSPDEWDLILDDEELDNELVSNDLLGDSCEDLTLKREMDEQEFGDGATASCPMCALTFLDLDSFEIQAHVNSCLDNRAPVASPPPTRKPLRPLTSYPTSAGSSNASKSPSEFDSRSKSMTAFSVLMSGNAERERATWAEAQAAEDRSFRPTKADRRKAPFYKVLTGMPIAVDAFRYGSVPGVQAYFLTHAHSDHYTNLSSNWKNGPIYCSATTANLIVHMLSVDRKWVHALPMDTPVEVPNTGGVKVTLIDANHCPGSCLFLFEGSQTINAGDSTFKSPFVGTSRVFRYLHCGDFRASPQHVLHPTVKGKHIDIVYLDTTYLNPRYCFPPQPLVVSACAELARRIVNGEPLDAEAGDSGQIVKNSIQGWMKVEEGKGRQKLGGKGDALVVVGTYSIGKERIVKAIAKALNTKVYCDARKTAILRCQDDPELHALLTKEPLEAGVHVVPLGQVTSDRFKEYMDRWKGRWSRAVAFRPTGWTYSPPAGSDPMPPVSRVVAAAQSRNFTYAHLKPARNSTTQLMQYGVPYSEHSSFAELACFALSVDCTRVVATVNVGSAASRTKMQKWVERWDAERKRRREAGSPAVVEYRHLEYW